MIALSLIPRRKKRIMKQRRLPFTNQWMFNRVMLKESICRKVIRATTGIDAGCISYLNAEQAIEPSPENRGIRMDVFARDDGRMYDIEMQSEPEFLLGKRFRYYQSAIDTKDLPRGADYNDLLESYIVFVCKSDPFGYALPVYHLDRACQEAPRLAVGDESHWIALNARAWENLADNDLLDLLRYVESAAPCGPLSREIDAAVNEANEDRKWVDTVWSVSTIEENNARRHRIGLRLAREEGVEEGAARFAALADQLLEQGRIDDLKRATHDKEFRDALLASLDEPSHQ